MSLFFLIRLKVKIFIIIFFVATGIKLDNLLLFEKTFRFFRQTKFSISFGTELRSWILKNWKWKMRNQTEKKIDVFFFLCFKSLLRNPWI
jgi:hypothetical protein